MPSILPQNCCTLYQRCRSCHIMAEACKSVEYAMKKCPNGMYSEIKYDGERVQVHKKGNEFKYFSRSLKPVMPHKVKNFAKYIPEAFPHGKDLILDSEVLLVDVNTGKPLPFGSLGIHKQNEFKDANVCLFVFDCIYYNGQALLDRSVKERRKILEQNMKEVPNRIMFSEMEEIHHPKDLANMITKVLKLGLEGLVLKDLMGTYEPGKRHWLKVKKDYLFGGAMADSADLVVLGAWFGTGHKGGMMSVFLMGCYDAFASKWCTVTKVHTGHDDKTLERLQDELDPNMIKISKDASKVPGWLDCTKTMIPDFVAKDPKVMPVWEITGAEFTKHDVHTASGISIRFPRVTKIRDDKTWQTATSLSELEVLFKNSKVNMDFNLPPTSYGDDNDSDSASSSVKGSPKKINKNKPTSSNSDIKNQDSKVSMTTKPAISYDSEESESDNEILTKRKREVKPSSSEISNKVSGVSAINTESKAKVNYDSDENTDTEALPTKKKKQDMSTTLQYVIKKPLPDIFTGVKLVLPDCIAEDRGLLERFFIAYGGELLQPSKMQESTHVVHLDKSTKEDVALSSWPRDARHVQLRWLWDSIKLQKLQESRKYVVTLSSRRL